MCVKGQATPKSFGLNENMMQDWYDYTLSHWRKYLTVAYIRWIIGLLFMVWIVIHRWSPLVWVNTSNIIWAFLLVVWGYYSSNVTYISYIYFNSLCYYFRIRYAKVSIEKTNLYLDSFQIDHRFCIAFFKNDNNLLIEVINCYQFLKNLKIIKLGQWWHRINHING